MSAPPATARQPRLTTGLSFLLTVAAGAIDLLCVTRLGDAFASIMTGNLIFLGSAAVIRDGAAAVRLATALGCFVVGVAVGTAVVGRRRDGDRDWPGRVTVALTLELLLLGGFLASWVVLSARPSDSWQVALIAMAAGAMGMQTGAYRGVGTTIPSTTYFTGTLAGLIAGAVAERRFTGVSLLLLLALAGGALASAGLLATAPLLAPALPTALILVVILTSAAAAWLAHRRSRAARTTGSVSS